MKKKLVRLLGVAALVLVVAACGKNESKVDQVIQNQIEKADAKKEAGKDTVSSQPVLEDTKDFTIQDIDTDTETGEGEAATSYEETGDYSNVDVDLTQLSSTMVYSEVYHMMMTPTKYIDKIVKMNGMFVVYTNVEETVFYPAVIVADATACCSQGIEFLLKDEPSYPEGYPELGIDVTVTGVFETYDEDGNTFCRLKNAVLD